MKLRRVLACVVTLCLLAGILFCLTGLVQRKSSDYKYEAFFEEEENFDVLFMGTSHVINGVFPMELWNDYGITSYNFGGHANAIATIYWVNELALQYTSPSLVVVDCHGLGGNSKTATKYSNVHLSMDAFPLTLTKIKAVFDLLDDGVMDSAIENGSVTEEEKRTPLSLLWDFSVYHSRWAELAEDDFDPSFGVEKGAESRIAVAVPNEILEVPRETKLEEDTVAIEYLERLITECQDRGIDVLLTYLPFPATESEHAAANRVYDIAKEYGVDYINFLDMDIVDYNTDCYDSNSHLNPSGARKVTDYLGQYIMEHYDIEDHREDENYAGWLEDYETYKDYKVSKLREQTALDVYLMLLADKHYDVSVSIKDHRIFASEYYCELFENLGADVDKIGEDVSEIVICGGQEVEYKTGQADMESSMVITVTDRDTGETVDTAAVSLSIDMEKEEPVVSAAVSHSN